MELTEVQKKQIEEVREWIVDILSQSYPIRHLSNWCPDKPFRKDGTTICCCTDCQFRIATEILSKFAILDKDQSLIEIKHEVCSDEAEQLARDHYEAGWNNGVNKAYRLGFRRIILPSKEVTGV